MDDKTRQGLQTLGLHDDQIDGIGKVFVDRKKSRCPNFGVFGISIAMVALGASYWNDCVYDISLVMVVMGGTLLAFALLGILSMCTKCEYDDKCYDKLEPLFGIANFAILIWASVVVFGHYAVWDYENEDAENYCHYTPYMFMFVTLILMWVLLPCIMLCCCMCCCTAALCSCCCGKKGNEVSEAGKEMA